MSAHTLHGTTRIFVYGTLRQGQRNHYLMREAIFVGTAETVDQFTLRIDGGLPFLDERDPRYAVRGEVYEVGQHGLRLIDALENHPRWYCRRPIAVRLDQGDGAAVIDAYAYFHPNAPGVIHPTGDFVDPLTARPAAKVSA